MNIEIANRLVNLRKANNLSQEALAEKLGISRQAVSKWERAEASPDTDNLILLARLYGVSLDELLKTEEELPMPEKPVTEVSITEEPDNYVDISGKKYSEGWFPNYRHFPMWVVISIIYIVLGVMWNAWHPGWMVFLTIPLYYPLIAWYRGKGREEEEDHE